MFRRSLHEAFRDISYDGVKRSTVRGHLYLFFRDDSTITRISFQPMNRIVRPIGTHDHRRLIMVLLGDVHLLHRSTKDGIHSFPLRFYIYNLR